MVSTKRNTHLIADGADGADDADGTDGADDADGTDGADGADGADDMCNWDVIRICTGEVSYYL